MSNKFKGKYRISSIRLQNWDYGWNGLYFITICSHQREHHFGEIRNKQMLLSKAGELAHQYWAEIPKRFHFAKIDAFIVMPDHIHGIVKIDKIGLGGFSTIEDKNDGEGDTDAINRVSPANTIEIQKGGATGNKNPMLHQNLSRIIRWYKGRTTYESRKYDPNFEWQSRFHDHIIRDVNELQRIRNYIDNNVINWKDNHFE